MLRQGHDARRFPPGCLSPLAIYVCFERCLQCEYVRRIDLGVIYGYAIAEPSIVAKGPVALDA